MEPTRGVVARGTRGLWDRQLISDPGRVRPGGRACAADERACGTYAAARGGKANHCSCSGTDHGSGGQADDSPDHSRRGHSAERHIQTTYGLSYLLIAHNLATVRYMSHAVAIMYLGQIVEYAEGDELFEQPLHPYTKALMSAALPSHPDEVTEEIVFSGEMPSPLNPPSGCHFHPRCPHAMDVCRRVAPAVIRVGGSHTVSCHLYNGVSK